ncbi:hypothetical protein QFC21_002182 [Naganishia friedmannii]|uniref:Uncharacterized protein n=1 Tax=Naganishia friedmannii TaxID=89922 RepID=A0ACC2W0C3_9TREE|nr:hypothetical protein QFC21_002182 [Naganishia friedmannii]
MTVITRRQARTAATQSSSSRQSRQPESPEVERATPVADRVQRHHTQESSRTKAELIGRCMQPGRIETLPAEIIELIAQRLRDHTFVEDDQESNDFPEAASQATAHPSPCACQTAEEVPSPRNSSRNVAHHGNFEPSDHSIPFSSTSTRFRQVVFDQRLNRAKLVKYCAHSMKRSADMSEALRRSVEVNVSNGFTGDVSALAADVDPATITFVGNLEMILNHLPLPNVEDVTVNIWEWMFSHFVDTETEALRRALQAMHFPQMKRFEVLVQVQVLFPVMVESIWDEIEKCFVDALHQDTLKEIVLEVNYRVAACHHALSHGNVFLLLGNDHADMSPLLLPTHDRLKQLFQRFRSSCKNLHTLEVNISGCFSMIDREKVFDILNFRIHADNEQQPASPKAAHGSPGIRANLSSAGNNEGVEYKVNQEGIDLVAGTMQKLLAEPVQHHSDDIENEEDENDEDEDENDESEDENDESEFGEDSEDSEESEDGGGSTEEGIADDSHDE